MNRLKTGITIFIIVILSLITCTLGFVVVSIFNTSEVSTTKSDVSTVNGGIEVDKGLFGDVSITLPSELFALFGDEATATLTEEQKKNGLTKAEKLSDGSVKYTIKRSAYKDFLKEYRQETIESLNNLYGDDGFQSVKNITYNDDFSKITIFVEKSQYDGSFDTLVVMSAGLCGRMYQAFDADAPQKVVIEVKDNSNGNVIETKTYPEE